MKIVFAGTPEFAAIALEALIQSKHEIVAVYTQPDKPSGRGLKVKFSPVKTLALQYKLAIFQPVSLKDEHDQQILQDLAPDVIVVAAYGLLLPAKVLAIPKFHCINIHPSLLPRWRGAAPIQRTIHAGDVVSGVSIMQMDTGLDTGPVLLQRQYVLDAQETSASLHNVLAKLGGEALLQTLDLIEQNKMIATPQDNSMATYAQKISKEEALIDWHEPAQQIEYLVRAFNPWPIAYTTWQGQNIRIWQAKAISDQSQPADIRKILHVSKDGIDIGTGKGVLRLLAVQMPGGKVISCNDFYNAKKTLLHVGEQFV